MAVLVSGNLLDAALSLGVQVDFWSLTAAMTVAVAYLALRLALHNAKWTFGTSNAEGGPAKRHLLALLILPVLVAGGLVSLAPTATLKVLSTGTDNAAWLFVSSQFATQQSVWPGHGGAMTVLIALGTGVGRLVAGLSGTETTSASVALTAITFLWLASIGLAGLVARVARRNRRSLASLVGAFFVGLVLLVDYGHLSAWLVVVLAVASIALYERADRHDQTLLLWIGSLSLTVWLPVKPMALICVIGVLILTVKSRRSRSTPSAVLLLDAAVIFVPLALSARTLANHVVSVGAFASSFPSLWIKDLLNGAAEYLAMPGGTHAFPVLIAVGVFALVGLTLWNSPRTRNAPTLGLLVVCAWTVGLVVIDLFANGGTGYGSQKLLLVTMIVCAGWLAVSPTVSGFGLATVAVLLSAGMTISLVRTHVLDGQDAAPRGEDSWVETVVPHLDSGGAALPVACLTDPTWEKFDDPVADDHAWWSSFTCTRFVGSLAGRDDLPNEILRFNTGLETWRQVATRAGENPFLLDQVLILDQRGRPYRITRLLDYVAETASLRALAVEARSQVVEAVSNAPLPHSIDLIDTKAGVIGGWVGSTVSSIVVISNGLSESAVDLVPRFPRADVELTLGARELASGFQVRVAVNERASVCVLLRGLDGRLHLSNRQDSCTSRDDVRWGLEQANPD